MRRAEAPAVTAAEGGVPYLGEALVTLSLVAGWGLVTWSLAELLGRWELVPLSAGLFLLGMVGFRLLGTILVDGLYVLSRDGG